MTNITHFKLEYRRLGKAAGWTIMLNGHYLVQLEPWLIVAACKAVFFELKIRRIQRQWERDRRRK